MGILGWRGVGWEVVEGEGVKKVGFGVNAKFSEGEIWRRIRPARDLASGIRLASAVRQVDLVCASSAWITGHWPTLPESGVMSSTFSGSVVRHDDYTLCGLLPSA